MRAPTPETAALVAPEPQADITAGSGYQPPRYELICLACEISAYAPDGDLPLF